jgi:outer membrane protein assembly factor BamB
VTAVGARLLLACVAIAACGPKTEFRLSSTNDNDSAALSAALAQRQLPAQPEPHNTAHVPRAFIALAGSPKTLVAYDLSADKVLWKTPANLSSRVWVGGDFLVDVEGKELVARDQQRGSVRWKVSIPGELVGAAADRERAYVVSRQGSNASPVWRLSAYDGASGSELWKTDAEGQLGAPTAQGGVVYSPFLTQWLSLLDGKTGKQLARIRGVDEQISIVRATSTATYYGSRQGVFLLDARSASGKREGATYGKVQIPPQLDRASYGRDMYDSVQAGYTAADRARVLWTSEPSDAGPMKFANDSYAIHYFRYVFGFSTAGDLLWAYQHPRVELVASDTTGSAIVAIAQNGELVAIDAKTGAVRLTKNLTLGAPVLGATFDADGWAPQGESQPVATVAALVAIARDHDARFDKVKELAVSSLAKMPGGEVTKELLAVLADKRAPQKLKDTVAELLVQRKDPSSLPELTTQLALHSDFLAKTEPEALGPIARAISGLAGAKLEKAQIEATLTALQSHLDAPSTQSADLVLVIDAMSAVGGGAERPALASHLLLYHCDDDLGADPAWGQAIVRALHDRGGPGERELLRRVSHDPRTQPALAKAIADAIAGD